MDFSFSQEQLMLQDSVSSFMQTEVSPELIRQLWDSETGRSETLWQQIVELGLTGLLIPEEYGGLGMSEVDFVLLAQECGRVALPEPLVTMAMVGSTTLASLAEDNALCRELLPQLASGEKRLAVGHTANHLVSDAHIADYLLLPAGDEIHLLERSQVDITAQQSVDPSRRLFSIDWQPSAATRVASGQRAVELLAVSLNRGAVGVAAQLLGLAEKMVEMTVAYTTDRQQFGRPIGANQALKQKLADCAVKNEFAKPVLYRAAYTLAQQPERADFAVSHAKVSASEAALLAAKHCIQCHGAMGYTWECDLHIFMKRAWALDKSWGHNGFHKNRLHQWLLNPSAKIGADKTFGIQA